MLFFDSYDMELNWAILKNGVSVFIYFFGWFKCQFGEENVNKEEGCFRNFSILLLPCSLCWILMDGPKLIRNQQKFRTEKNFTYIFNGQVVHSYENDWYCILWVGLRHYFLNLLHCDLSHLQHYKFENLLTKLITTLVLETLFIDRNV